MNNLKKFYGTFGQNHVHRINGFTYDADVVIEIQAENHGEAHDKMFELFDKKWSFIYGEKPKMEYFPRGIKEYE